MRLRRRRGGPGHPRRRSSGRTPSRTSTFRSPPRPAGCCTRSSGPSGPIGLVLLDGRKDLCLPVLRLLAPGPGA